MEPYGIVIVLIQYDALGAMVLLAENIKRWTIILCPQASEMEEHVADDVGGHRLVE